MTEYFTKWYNLSKFQNVWRNLLCIWERQKEEGKGDGYLMWNVNQKQISMMYTKICSKQHFGFDYNVITDNWESWNSMHTNFTLTHKHIPLLLTKISISFDSIINHEHKTLVAINTYHPSHLHYIIIRTKKHVNLQFKCTLYLFIFICRWFCIRKEEIFSIQWFRNHCAKLLVVSGFFYNENRCVSIKNRIKSF